MLPGLCHYAVVAWKYSIRIHSLLKLFCPQCIAHTHNINMKYFVINIMYKNTGAVQNHCPTCILKFMSTFYQSTYIFYYNNRA